MEYMLDKAGALEKIFWKAPEKIFAMNEITIIGLLRTTIFQIVLQIKYYFFCCKCYLLVRYIKDW